MQHDYAEYCPSLETTGHPYAVRDIRGGWHYFRSAAVANSIFPGAFR